MFAECIHNIYMSYKSSYKGLFRPRNPQKYVGDHTNIVYRPVEREFYTEETVREKFNLDPHNFILYKTLLGDASDALPGIKGLGAGKLFKLFPELSTQPLTFEDILDISEKNMSKHVIYARVLHDIELLENKYKIMAKH